MLKYRKVLYDCVIGAARIVGMLEDTYVFHNASVCEAGCIMPVTQIDTDHRTIIKVRNNTSRSKNSSQNSTNHHLQKQKHFKETKFFPVVKPEKDDCRKN